MKYLFDMAYHDDGLFLKKNEVKRKSESSNKRNLEHISKRDSSHMPESSKQEIANRHKIVPKRRFGGLID